MIIKSKNVWLQGRLQPAEIEFSSTIERILPYGSSKDAEDLGELWVLPGLIDTHTHGNNGVDSAVSSIQEINRWQREITADGVTSFMATTATDTPENNIAAFERLSKCVGKGEGAEILGIYMEGNFINPKHKGAHDERLIAKPDAELLKQYIAACHGTMRLMILAPELDKGHAVLKTAIENGVRVSVGHSRATYSECCSAFADGAVSVTHTYNGMCAFNHREPGIIGAAATQKNIFAEIIADGHHVSWPAVQMLCALKDDRHIVLVTDASPAKDWQGELPAGIYRDEQGQFRTMDGALCSSSLRMCDGVYNLIKYADVSLEKAINSATINPATLLGVSERKGSIAPGKDADIIAVTPSFEVVQTYCRGNMFGIA